MNKTCESDKQKLTQWGKDITNAVMMHPEYSGIDPKSIQLIYKYAANILKETNNLIGEINE